MSKSLDHLFPEQHLPLSGTLMVALPCAAEQLTNDKLSLTVSAQDGSYELGLRGTQPVLKARVGAQVDHQWLRSSDYPQRHAAESAFSDGLGSGRQVTVTCSGLDGKPELVYILQLYDQRPYGTVQVKVQNNTGNEVTVQAIRSVDAIGEPVLDLGGHQSANRVLSDSFSEDWPDMSLYDLGAAPGGLHRGVGANSSTIRKASRVCFLPHLPQAGF